MECKIKNLCGSCDYMGINYPKQLDMKTKYCNDLLRRFHLSHIKVHPMIGSTPYKEYRNKIIVAFNSKYEYGLYEEHSHRIIPYHRCLLHDEESDQIIKKIQEIVKKYHVSIYDEKRRRGLLRHVLIRKAVMTNQVMVVLVCNEEVFPGSKHFSTELIQQFPHIKTIVLNINKRKTSIVLGEKEKVLYGKGFIVDKLCNLSFKISSRSFYQINHNQCETIYQKALSLLQLKKQDVIIDAYCGIGTIGMIAASQVKKVIGVEVNKDAIKDAINNAKMNHIHNITFVCDDASYFMTSLAKSHTHIDGVIMDPPRSGSNKEFMDAIKVLKPRKVAYISCNPETLLRDLKYFKQIGYQTKELYPYDMFPYTKHIESVVLLTSNQRSKNT